MSDLGVVLPTGEVANPTPEQVAPYTEEVTQLGQVEVGQLVVLRSPSFPGMSPANKIAKVQETHENHKGIGPAVSASGTWVYLDRQLAKKNMGSKFKLFRAPAGDEMEDVEEGEVREDVIGGRRKTGRRRPRRKTARKTYRKKAKRVSRASRKRPSARGRSF